MIKTICQSIPASARRSIYTKYEIDLIKLRQTAARQIDVVYILGLKEIKK